MIARARAAGVATLLAAFLASWASCALALDRAGAIAAAKRQMGGKCGASTPCGFDAKQEGNRWHVRVEFLDAGAAPGKPSAGAKAHAIYIFDQSGRLVGTVQGR